MTVDRTTFEWLEETDAIAREILDCTHLHNVATALPALYGALAHIEAVVREHNMFADVPGGTDEFIAACEHMGRSLPIVGRSTYVMRVARR